MHKAIWTYQFVTTDDGHDAERLDAVILGIERRVRAIVSEDDIGVDFSVQIGDTNLVADDSVFETRFRLSITAAAASSVFASTALLAIAIDVHVHKLLSVAVQVDDA